MGRSQPVISKRRRTDGGSLPTSVLHQAATTLLQWGFILLPSDTCYSLGALPLDESIRRKVNAILGRDDDPISLAFGGYAHARRVAEVDETTAVLLERFTPGPITVVCRSKTDVPDELLSTTIGSHDGTIGVRIPDSHIERDVAAGTRYPLMTVAVREPGTGEAVQDFERALELVGAGIERAGGAAWLAVEGDEFYATHSTVVRVAGLNQVELLREGDISFADIREALKPLSGWAGDEWR